MASPAQINANQANAQLSTGPRTVEGKARISQNAVRHGLTARHLVIRDDEKDDFAALNDSLFEELDPQGALETITFHELLHAAWNLQRFSRIEAEVSLGTADDFTDPGAAAVLDRLARYQSRAQRAFYKAQTELRILQTNRALRARKLTAEEDAKVPANVSINDLTKQTHSEVTAEAIDIAVRLLNYEAGVGTLTAFKKRDEPRP
uniref:Uncharacterized protein n=1 Tax=Solibacter usitatus (strain Ellin6076) TaxID=234267 RepID=Q022N7_SOLUE